MDMNEVKRPVNYKIERILKATKLGIQHQGDIVGDATPGQQHRGRNTKGDNSKGH
jgi:hypothetical protein